MKSFHFLIGFIGRLTVSSALAFASGLPLAHTAEKEPELAIRMEQQALCASCASYVLGFLEDGSSYFLGKNGVRAMAIRGSYVRREGYFFNEHIARFLARALQPQLSKYRDALAKWGDESMRVGIFETPDSERDRTCGTDIAARVSARIRLHVEWSGKKGFAEFCIGPRTPPDWERVIASLRAIYEYPDDYFQVPVFRTDDSFVVRFAHLWEFVGGIRGPCSPYAEDYVMYLARDGTVTMVGRRAVLAKYPGLKIGEAVLPENVGFATIATDLFRSRAMEEIAGVLADADRLRSLPPADTSKVGGFIGGTASEPLTWRTLHLKELGSAEITDLSAPLNPLVAPGARARVDSLARLAKDVARLLPPVEGLKEYCRSLPLFK